MADAINTGPQEFMKANFPTVQETTEILREMRPYVKRRAPGEMHAEMLWRLRRGEDVTIDRLAAIWPIFQRDMLVQYAHHLADMGFVRFDGTTLQLEERAA